MLQAISEKAYYLSILHKWTNPMWPYDYLTHLYDFHVATGVYTTDGRRLQFMEEA